MRLSPAQRIGQFRAAAVERLGTTDSDVLAVVAALLGLRVILFEHVLAFHSYNYSLDKPDISPTYASAHPDEFWHGSSFMVSCFFVLSGFHLYQRWLQKAFYDEPLSVKQFLKRRAARLLPLYYVTTLVVIALSYHASLADGVVWPQNNMLWPHLLMLQNYFPQTLGTLNLLSWFVGLVASFYLILPVIGLATIRLRRNLVGQWAIIAAMIGISLAWRFFLYGHLRGAWATTIALAPPTYFLYFGVGMGLALLNEQTRLRRGIPLRFSPAMTALSLALWAGGTALMYYVDGPLAGPVEGLVWWKGLATAVAGLTGVLFALGGRGPLTAWLRHPLMLMLSMLSFGIFLWHWPVLLLFRRLDIFHFGGLGTFLLVSAFSLVLSVISYQLLERPLLRWSSYHNSERRPPD